MVGWACGEQCRTEMSRRTTTFPTFPFSRRHHHPHGSPPRSLFSHGHNSTQKPGFDRGNVLSPHNAAILRLHIRPPDRPPAPTNHQTLLNRPPLFGASFGNSSRHCLSPNVNVHARPCTETSPDALPCYATSCEATTHCDSSSCFEREVGLVGHSGIVDLGQVDISVSLPSVRRYHGFTAGYIKRPQRCLHVVFVIHSPPLSLQCCCQRPRPRPPRLHLVFIPSPFCREKQSQSNLPRWSAPGLSMSSSTTTPVTLVRVGRFIPRSLHGEEPLGDSFPRDCGFLCLFAQVA